MAPVYQIHLLTFQAGSDFSKFFVYVFQDSRNKSVDKMQKKPCLIVSFPLNSPFHVVGHNSPSSQTFYDLVAELKLVMSVHPAASKLAEFEAKTMKDGEHVGKYKRSLRYLYQVAVGINDNSDTDLLYTNKFIR